MYKIDLGNGNLIEAEKNGAWYIAQVEEGVFEGVGKCEIESEDGFKMTLKRGKVEGLTKYGDGVRFMLRELSKEERQEKSRVKRQTRQNEWINERYDRVSVTLPKGTKEKIMERGYSVNAFINEAVKVMLEVE